MAVLSDAQREAGWTIAKLGDIATLVMGTSPKSSDVVDYPLGIPLLNGPAEFTDKYPVPVKWTEKGIRFSEPGDILFCVRATLGKMNFSDRQYAIGRGLAAIRGIDELHTRYIYYTLLSTMESILRNANGTIYLSVTKSDVENFEIPLPPKDTLKRIAGILGSLDDKIEANTRLIQTLDSLGEAATRKYLKSVQKTQKLNDIAHIVMGQSPKGETLNTEGSGVLFFQGKKDFGFRYPTPRTYTTAATRMAEPLDILFSVRAPIGALNRSVEACCVGRGLAAIRSSCGQENTLFYTLKTNPALPS